MVDYQHGFRKNRSCETQLLSTLESLTRSYDNKAQTDLIVLDFSKAFDTVPHQRLLQKLDSVGIRNTSENRLLGWFRSWLCDRKQKVTLEGQESDPCNVTSGVPQGTVLGPLCFLIYINDIGNELSKETNLKLFADDSLIFREIRTIEDAIALQKDLESLTQWSKKWQMSFHPSKCQLVMTINSKRHKISHQYKMLGQPLENVDSIQYLGVHIQNDLKWDRHVNYITNKANRSLGFIKRNLHQCPKEVKAQAYKALIRPTLEYASTAWDPHLQKHILQLEGVQKRAARFVTNCRSREPGCLTNAVKTLEWETLETRRKHSRLAQIYRTINGDTSPINIPPYFKPQSTRYSTRNYHKNKYLTPYTRTDTYKNSFFPRTLTEWSQLPKNVINCSAEEQFRRFVKLC